MQLSDPLARELFALAIRAAHLKALAEQAEAEMQRLMAQVRLVRGIPDDANLSLDVTVAAAITVVNPATPEVKP